MKFRWLIALAAVAIAGAAHAAPRQAQATLRPCHLPGHDETLQCARIPVPLDHGAPAGQRLDTHVTIAPAFRQPARPDPLFILAGGPGQAGSDLLLLLDGTFRKVRATRDIVFIDQRGTGLSGKLDCAETKDLEEIRLDEQEQIVAACLRKLGKPYRHYTTDQSAADLEVIRAALGYGQINLWGGSYGTRLAQAYARKFPASVRALVLDGVVPPEQIVFAWGADAQAALNRVFTDCENDAHCNKTFPGLRGQFATLVKKVQAGIRIDYSHPRTAAQKQTQLEPSAFLQTIRTSLYSPMTRIRLPYLIDSAARGNWRPFVAQMHAIGDSHISASSLGLMLSVTCAEDIPRLSPEIVAEEERSSFLAGIEVRTIPAWCRHVGVPAAPQRAPERIAAPALLLSGAYDPVTPPRRAEQTMKHLAQAQHVVVQHGGHIVSPMGCVSKLVRDFLDRPAQKVDAQCVAKIPAMGFQLGAAGPKP